jgi:hypothetical protein
MKKAPKKTQPGMQTGWDTTRELIKSGKTKLEFGWSETSCPGCYAIEVKPEKGTTPYGWVWYRHETGHVISISMSYVPEFLRRCGLRTAMHKELLRWFPNTRMIVTGRATESSAPWLLSQGFVFNQDFDRWELLITPPTTTPTV